MLSLSMSPSSTRGEGWVEEGLASIGEYATTGYPA